MFAPFESLSPASRLWIFQSDKVFNSRQRDILFEALSAFTQTWLAHGNPMKASFQLPYDHFILLAADEGYTAASGCSIDGSVRVLKEISAQTGLDLLNRKNVAFKQNDSVELLPMSGLKAGLEQGRWNKDTLTFNNLITTKAELSEWILPAERTWLKRYLSPEPAYR